MTELDSEALRATLLRQIEHRYVAEGQLVLPAVPALRDQFESWASGRDAFGLPRGEAPIELRWLAYRRRGG